MAFCKDGLVDYLRNSGYNVVRLPRQGIKPLDFIVKQDKQYEDLGTIKTIWTAAGEAPQPSVDAKAAGISKRETSLLDISIGLTALDSIFQGLGVKVPKLKTAFSKTNKLKIVFNNVIIEKVEPLLIGAYLKSQDNSKLDTNNIMVKNMIENGLPAYIISEVLLSNSITIESYKDAKTGVELDVNLMNDALTAGTDTMFQKTTESSITYEGGEKDFLVFGFKCFGLRYGSDGWNVTGPGGKIFLGAAGVLLDDEPLLDLQ